MSIDDLVTLADILRPLRDCVAQASHLAHQPSDTEGEDVAAFHAALQAKVGTIGTELQDLTEYVSLRRLTARSDRVESLPRERVEVRAWRPPSSLDSDVPVLRLDMNGRRVDAETPTPDGRWADRHTGSRVGGKPPAIEKVTEPDARPNGDWPTFMLRRHERHVGSFGANFSFCQHTECRDMRRSFTDAREMEPA